MGVVVGSRDDDDVVGGESILISGIRIGVRIGVTELVYQISFTIFLGPRVRKTFKSAGNKVHQGHPNGGAGLFFWNSNACLDSRWPCP